MHTHPGSLNLGSVLGVVTGIVHGDGHKYSMESGKIKHKGKTQGKP